MDVLEAAWDSTGVTFLGRERPALFRIAGTRRMAARFGWSERRALACGRAAHRIWRHWFESCEAARLEQVARWPVPSQLAALPDLSTLYRSVRAARRTGGETADLAALPMAYRGLLTRLADQSRAELRPPVVAERPPGLLVAVARALLLTPLGLGAARYGAADGIVWARARESAARLLWMLTGPWAWTPRPVVRGPRRARQEARARAARGRW